MKKVKNFTAENISYLFFYLFLVTFTLPVRKIVYDNQSFITGLFSEFTSIFFEWSEVFLSICFLFYGFSIIKNKVHININKKLKVLMLMLLIIILGSEIAIMFAYDKKLAFLSTLKFIELFGVIIFLYASQINIHKVIKVLFLIAVYQGFIGLLQHYLGSSIGFHFLGEQVFDINTPGSPKIIYNGSVFLRATGTFLHPNILSCFLVSVFFLSTKLEKSWRIFRWLLIIPIIFTFSRAGIAALIMGIIIESRKPLISLAIVFASFAILSTLIYYFPEAKNILISRINIDNSFIERWQFVKISKELFFHYPLGTGAKNYLIAISPISSHLSPWQLQPVHNVFLLSANELGIFSGISLLSVFIYLSIKLKKMRPILMTLFIFGMLDHFLITIHSGFMLLAIVIGIYVRNDKVVMLDKLKSLVGKN